MADTPLHLPEGLQKLLDLHSWPLSSHPYSYLDSQQQVKRRYDTFGPKRLMAAVTGRWWRNTALTNKPSTLREIKSRSSVLKISAGLADRPRNRYGVLSFKTNNDTNHLSFSDCGRRMGPAPL
jgi:hypothetical protein